MYSEKIEALIQAALADGELSEKEKQILFKRAQDEGVDLDEFEMVLNAKLYELSHAKKEQTSAPKSNRFGDIRKCPACGAILQSFQHKCDECGYEFRNMDAVQSASKLFDLLQAAELRKSQKLQEQEQFKATKLEKFDAETDLRLSELSKRHNGGSDLSKIIGAFTGSAQAQNEERDDLIRTRELSRTQLIHTLDKDYHNIEKQYSQEKYVIIKNFPVPNTKEDLLELLAMATSNAYDNDGVIGPEEEVWIQKTDQIYQKVIACAGSDTMFSDQASTMVIALMRRLPHKYKNFTQLSDSAKKKLKTEKDAEKKAKLEVYKSVFKIAGPICLALIIVGVIGIFVELTGLAIGGFIGGILSLIIAKKIAKNKIISK